VEHSIQLKTSYQQRTFRNLREFITILKVLAVHKHETIRVSLSASLNKNTDFLHLPFVTISMYLGDACPLAPPAPPVGRHPRPPTSHDVTHLGHHFISQPHECISLRNKCFRTRKLICAETSHLKSILLKKVCFIKYFKK
jgi:hypothetical protein